MTDVVSLEQVSLNAQSIWTMIILSVKKGKIADWIEDYKFISHQYKLTEVTKGEVNSGV